MTLVFSAWDPAAPTAPHDITDNIVYLTLRRAVETSPVPAKTKADLLRAVELQRKLLALADEVQFTVPGPDGALQTQAGYRLRADGGTLSLSHGELAMLREDWEQYRATQPRSAARLLLAIDERLAGAQPEPLA